MFFWIIITEHIIPVVSAALIQLRTFLGMNVLNIVVVISGRQFVSLGINMNIAILSAQILILILNRLNILLVLLKRHALFTLRLKTNYITSVLLKEKWPTGVLIPCWINLYKLLLRNLLGRRVCKLLVLLDNLNTLLFIFFIKTTTRTNLIQWLWISLKLLRGLFGLFHNRNLRAVHRHLLCINCYPVINLTCLIPLIRIF